MLLEVSPVHEDLATATEPQVADAGVIQLKKGLPN